MGREKKTKGVEVEFSGDGNERKRKENKEKGKKRTPGVSLRYKETSATMLSVNSADGLNAAHLSDWEGAMSLLENDRASRRNGPVRRVARLKRADNEGGARMMRGE